VYSFGFISPHDALDADAWGVAQLRYVVDGRIYEVVKHAERLDVVSRAVLSRLDVRIVGI
jgi:hypothetical protein